MKRMIQLVVVNLCTKCELPYTVKEVSLTKKRYEIVEGGTYRQLEVWTNSHGMTDRYKLVYPALLHSVSIPYLP